MRYECKTTLLIMQTLKALLTSLNNHLHKKKINYETSLAAILVTVLLFFDNRYIVPKLRHASVHL